MAVAKDCQSMCRPAAEERFTMGERPSYLELIRERQFGTLWIAQLVSQSGDYIFNVALLWLVLTTTDSTLLVGLTQAIVVLPQVVAGPVAGVFADRYNRRNVMIISNFIQGILTAALSILYLEGALRFPIIILIVLCLFTAAQFMRAALGAILPRIVGKPKLGAANSLLSLTSSANQLVGYALGGIVFAAIGAAASISYDSFTFFFAAVALTFVTRSFGQVGAEVPEPGKVPRESFAESFREGLVFVRRSRVFLELMVFGLMANFFSIGATAVLAPYVMLQLHGGAEIYGFSLASVALGAITGSGIVGKMDFRRYVGKLLIIGVTIFGVLIALLGAVSWIPAAFAIFFGAGMVLGSINPPITVLMQTKVPNQLFGRASTVAMSVLGSSQPVAAVLFGWLAGVLSVGNLLVMAGVLMCVISAALYIPFRDLREASY